MSVTEGTDWGSGEGSPQDPLLEWAGCLSANRCVCGDEPKLMLMLGNKARSPSCQS